MYDLELKMAWDVFKDKESVSIIKQIIDFLIYNEQITVPELLNISENYYSVIPYMSGVRDLIGLEFILEYNGSYVLSKQELREAFKYDYIVHPETNEIIKDYKEHVYIYYLRGSNEIYKGR